MKKLMIVLLVAVALTGCSNEYPVNPKHVNAASYVCAESGDYSDIYIINGFDDMNVSCNNGAKYGIVKRGDSKFYVEDSNDDIRNEAVNRYLKGEK